MDSTTAAIRSNKPYRILNNSKALVQWCRRQHAMGLDLDSQMFTVDDMSRYRVELDTEENSQPETFINKPDNFKLIEWVQWSKEFENYVAKYNTAQKSGVSLSYVKHNNAKRPDATAMELLPKTEQEY